MYATSDYVNTLIAKRTKKDVTKAIQNPILNANWKPILLPLAITRTWNEVGMRHFILNYIILEK